MQNATLEPSVGLQDSGQSSPAQPRGDWKRIRRVVTAYAESHIDDGQDVERWQDAIDFYRARPVLTDVEDYWTHYEYLDAAMFASISTPSRVSSSVNSSFFSPFNGLAYYSNNRATNQADDFMELVVTDRSIRTTINRLRTQT